MSGDASLDLVGLGGQDGQGAGGMEVAHCQPSHPRDGAAYSVRCGGGEGGCEGGGRQRRRPFGSSQVPWKVWPSSPSGGTVLAGRQVGQQIKSLVSSTSVDLANNLISYHSLSLYEQRALSIIHIFPSFETGLRSFQSWVGINTSGALDKYVKFHIFCLLCVHCS